MSSARPHFAAQCKAVFVFSSTASSCAPSSSAFISASWSPISAAPSKSLSAVALTAAPDVVGAAGAAGALDAAVGCLKAVAAAGDGAAVRAGNGSLVRINAYLPASLLAFLCIAVQATMLLCDVRHQRTGEGGNCSSPATSVSCSWLTRSSARPITYWSSNKSSRSNVGILGGPSSSGKFHLCHSWFAPALREPRQHTSSESELQTTAMRHSGNTWQKKRVLGTCSVVS